jgi:hypothetical protein
MVSEKVVPKSGFPLEREGPAGTPKIVFLIVPTNPWALNLFLARSMRLAKDARNKTVGSPQIANA